MDVQVEGAKKPGASKSDENDFSWKTFAIHAGVKFAEGALIGIGTLAVGAVAGMLGAPRESSGTNANVVSLVNSNRKAGNA